MSQIHLIDVLNQIDEIDVEGQPRIFSIKYVKYSKVSGDGGAIKTINRAVKNYKRTGKAPVSSNIKRKARKNPRHQDNQTRNFYDLDSSQIRKCHIRLITEFNGMKVIL